MKVAVIGCGRWGSFLTWYLDQLGYKVTLIGRDGSERFEQLKNTHTNGTVTLGENVRFAGFEALSSARIVVISIAAQNLRSMLLEHKSAFDDKTLVLCMKGLEKDTGKRLSEVVKETTAAAHVAVWVGPGHVEEFVAGIPNCMVIDSDDSKLTDKLVSRLSGGIIRFYKGGDLIGNEVGAAAKNVIGIAAGMLDGLMMSSLKGALMSRGSREIGRLIAAMGGNAMSVYGMAHLGDYQATVFSQLSHNRMFGEKFILKQEYGKLAEGVDTTRALHLLGKKYGVDLPIVNGVYATLFKGKDVKSELTKLFLRDIKKEMD